MNKIKRFFLALSFFLFCIANLNAAVYSRPRKLYVLKTTYFDFVFPHGAEQTIYFLAKNADKLFEKASEDFKLQKSFRIMVVLSFDSDLPSVSYTPLPFNRIMIFQAPSTGVGYFSESVLITKFYEAVAEAVASSVRSPFWQGASNIFGDTLQPVALLNVPSAFLDGVLDNYIYSQNHVIFDDSKSLVILSEAKKEGHFPSWRDCLGGRDIYPTGLSKIAYSAFAAYIQQRWGMEKFVEFWTECGKVDLFRLTNRLFQKVYGMPIRYAWSDFQDSIPVSEKPYFGETILGAEDEGAYFYIAAKDEIVYYYNSLKNNIYSINPSKKNLSKDKKLSKIATGIDCVRISDNGELLALSYHASKSDKELDSTFVQVYNLKTHIFIPRKLRLKCGAFVNTTVDKTGIAGFYTKNMKTFLKVYDIKNLNSYKEIYSIELPESCIAQGVANVGAGKILCIYYYKNDCIFQTVDIFKNISKFEKFPVTASNFKNCKIQDDKNAVCFTYTKNQLYESAKLGYFEIDKSEEKTVYLSENEFSGGINDAYINLDKIYFSCHRANTNELRMGRLSDLSFTQNKTQIIEPIDSEFSTSDLPDEIKKYKKTSEDDDTISLHGKYLGDFKVKNYNPFKYSLKGTWYPFIPIISSDIEQTDVGLGLGGLGLGGLGLGATFITRSDPLGIITSNLSFCKGYFDSSIDEGPFVDRCVASATLKTAILPVELEFHELFSFSDSGNYFMNTMLGSVYRLPLGMPHHKIEFRLRELWQCIAMEKDENGNIILSENWHSINDSYNLFYTYFNIKYSNYHQSGRSVFEQRGFEIGSTITCVYDPQPESFIGLEDPFAFDFNFTTGIKVPFLVPIFGVDDWVVCFPTTFLAKFFGQTGVPIDGYVETLLVGYELQKAIPGTPFYIQRFGIKGGYNFKSESADYSTEINTNPLDALKEADFSDYIYINLEVIASPSIGKFTSSKQFTGGVQFQIDVRNAKGKVKGIFKVNF